MEHSFSAIKIDFMDRLISIDWVDSDIDIIWNMMG